MAEHDHRVSTQIVDVDGHLPERLRGIDDRDGIRLPCDPARLRDGEDVAALARDERHEECARAVPHAALDLVQEPVGIALPRDLAQLVTMIGAEAQRVERASVLLERREDERASRDREPGDERVQPVRRRLRERDSLRAASISERCGHVRAGPVEGGVVGGVPDVAEHADLVQPSTEGFRGTLRDGKGGPRASDVEIQEVVAQRLQRTRRDIRLLVDLGRDVTAAHAVMMPRIASPAVKRAAKPRATDCPRGARSRTSEAASGIASASATP